ncbi:cytochrome [Amycolatopsis antarctica]|uniref:Cytochrome n=1 Tax=Amycolatopsis antarctica TaxID=1854586 RepID=A0A263D1A4_9PSEU|nr:cytochrome P450 [Amycolatopsis antarctica]OZM72264.1 cytochrome [Amycolatopsis antarctica]
MTTTESSAESTRPLPAITPARLGQTTGTPLYGEDFAADPERTYRALRAQGPIAPVQLAEGVQAMLVTDYATALQVLRSPHVFRKDSRRWQVHAPADSPIMPMMSWRPNTLFADGEAHARLRPPVTESLRAVDPAELRDFVHRSALTLIQGFTGRTSADVLTEYAAPLPLLVLHQVFGCPPDISARMVDSLKALWDGTDVQEANAAFERCVRELVEYKRREPGDDVTTRLLEHRHGLDDDELLHQLVVMMGAGVEPVSNWIANALLLLLTEDRFADSLVNGSVSIDEALDEVLWRYPPLANYAVTYPTRAVRLGGVRLPADMPVVISIAAANTDVASRMGEVPTGNRAHLAFSAGPHTCPARDPARLIATIALETVLDHLPGMSLADGTALQWRPGPFHRALTALPVQFPPPSQTPDPSAGDTECPHRSTAR